MQSTPYLIAAQAHEVGIHRSVGCKGQDYHFWVCSLYSVFTTQLHKYYVDRKESAAEGQKEVRTVSLAACAGFALPGS